MLLACYIIGMPFVQDVQNKHLVELHAVQFSPYISKQFLH